MTVLCKMSEHKLCLKYNTLAEVAALGYSGLSVLSTSRLEVRGLSMIVHLFTQSTA